MPVPSLISSGTVAATAATVVTPTTLTPGLPASRQNGDVLLCFTSCRSPTPTVSVAGWTQVLNLGTGTFGRLALFARVVDGTEAAPSVVWAGLTTGSSGSPAEARVACFRNLKVTAGAPVTDKTGTITNQAASSTAATGGGAIATLSKNQAIRLMLSVRQDDAGTWTADFFGQPVNLITHDATTSGADMTQEWDYGVLPTGGTTQPCTFTIAGGSSAGSSGIQITLEAAPITQAVGTATETDSAQPILPAKRVVVGTATETDVAQPIRPAKRVTVGTAIETDTARAISPAKRAAAGIATETDTARPVQPAKRVQAGTATESDTGQPITAAKRASMGTAEEVDAAQPVTPAKAQAIGTALEVDEALPITVGGGGGAPQIVPVGTAEEFDEALPITLGGQAQPVQRQVSTTVPPTGVEHPRSTRTLKTVSDLVRMRESVGTRAVAVSVASLARVVSDDRVSVVDPQVRHRVYAPSLLAVHDETRRLVKRRAPEQVREEESALLALLD